MRLVVYTDSAIFSGAEALFCDVVSDLSRRPEFEIEFAAPASNQKLVDRFSEATGRPLSFPVPAQPLPLAALHLYDPRRVAAIRRALRRARTDLLLINLPSIEYGATPLIANPLPGVATLGLAHITGSMRTLGFRLGAIREQLARRAIRRLDRVMVLSEQAAADFPITWQRPRIPADVIRMPVPQVEREDRESARRILGLPQDVPIVGIAGRVTIKQKGHDTLVAAAPRILESRPDVHFAIAGDGKDAATVEQMIDVARVADRFHILGHVNPIGLFLSAIDVIAIPSRFEGLPLIGLEALELGVPGVAASVDGLCDVWPERWRVPSGDPVRLADSISELLAAEDAVKSEMVVEGQRLMAPRVAQSASLDVVNVLLDLNEKS